MYICMVFQTHTGRSYLNPFFLLIEEKRTYMGSLEKISCLSPWFFYSFLSVYFPFSHQLIFHFCLCVCDSGWGFCFLSPPPVTAWPAWLRWLVPLAPRLPLQPLHSVPRPVRCGWGIKLSALCTLARQAGPHCPTPTTLWTTARPSKTTGSPNPPVCLLSCLSPCLAPC